MNFKRMEVFGFKSFADKITVDFNDGITGIVGPNGCGKSNVADVIRWVLGEQSPKILRGRNMQDVIFNGTTRRKPLSFCEASLIFDNSKKIFPNVEYEEVTITRKLYRSGDSEYLINKTNCRLKDIQDMIRDTGLGREGYSIVGQGRIDEIVNARPKDRRSIFEDAAGILKFKQRKIESERKLERTNDNICRLNDIIGELDKQLAPLQKQSEDAKKYLQLRDELRVLEANEYIYNYENNDSEKIKIELKLADFSAKHRSVLEQSEKVEKEYNDNTIEVANVDTYISKLRDEQTEMAVFAENIKGQGSTLNERISHLKTQRDEHSARIVEIEQQIEIKNTQLTDFVSRLGMANEEKFDNEKEYKALDKQFIALADEILSREHQIEDKNTEMLKTIESIGEIKADLGKLMTEREISLARIGEIDTEIKVVQEQITLDEKTKRLVEESVERCRRDKVKLVQSKNEVLSEFTTLKTKVDTARREINELNGSINSLQTKCRMLEEWKNEYEGFGGAVKSLMQAAKGNSNLSARVEGIVAEIINVPKEMEVAIETALGASVQNIVTKDENDAKYIIEYLKQNRMGRLTFLPMTSFKPRELDSFLRPLLFEKGCIGVASKLIKYDTKFSNIISGLLGRVVVCENMDYAIAISRKYSYAVKIVTLQGEVVNPSGSMSGGSSKSDSASLLGYERKIASAHEQLQQQQQRYNECSKILASGQDELEELQAQLGEYEEDVKNSEVAFATESGKLDKICSKIATLVEDMSGKIASKQKIVDKVALIDMAISSIDKKGEDVKDLRASVDDAAAKSKQEFDNKKKQKDSLSEQLTQMRIIMTANESEIAKLSSDIDRLNKEIDTAQKEKADSRATVKALEERIYQAENNLNTAVVSDEDKKKYENLIAKISSLDEYKKKLNQQNADLNTRKDELSKDLVAVVRDITKWESALEKIDETIATLEQHMSEEYELDYDGCLAYRRADFDIDKASSEIAKLKRSKNAIGAVNIDAIEQFTEVGGRYSEMTAQRDDLVRTADDLNKIIVELAKEMRSRFDREFAKINNNFQGIFKEIFGGGTGKLVIEEPEEGEDILESGIEILAELPGKRLQSITLYSGGEKALIAIAILFAILRLKAMPFCILDEVEAALDDTNASLFAKYLSRFSSETQFVVITHRKPTMELADRLFGVTMQEKGVSKVVSVSLSEAVKNVEEK